jgi:hypothetical protein
MFILLIKICKNILYIMGKWIQIELLGLCDKDMILYYYYKIYLWKIKN